MKKSYFPAANITDLKDGEMKQVSVDGTDVLLVKANNQYYAMGAFCTHYGAPLAKGALCGNHVICPWHHAWFDITNGDFIEPPALDHLPHYKVDIKEDQVFVELPAERTDRRTPSMSSCNTEADTRHFVILGGGAAGYMAAQTLREDGFVGHLIMITQENKAPYDRPPLSKDYLQGETPYKLLPLRDEVFYKKYGIEILTNKIVKEVDVDNKKISFESGDPLTYDSLLLATGGIPKRMKVPGSDLKNVFVLRSLDSAETLIKAVENAKNVVVVGASFIGMEAAASLQSRGHSVTVVAPDKVPFAKTLGSDIGNYFKTLHEEHGVQFKLNSKIKAFEGDSKVTSVLLESGERLKADIVLTGIGVVPATDILKGIDRQEDGGVVTDSYLSVAPGLYAAGDIAAVPNTLGGNPLRIEHWRYAQQQGRMAAHNMAGKKMTFNGVPFFWTAHFGVSLRYLGHAQKWDDIIIDGDIHEKKFIAFYIKDDRIIAMAGIGRDSEMAHLEQLLKDNLMPSGSALKKHGMIDAFGSFGNGEKA